MGAERRGEEGETCKGKVVVEGGERGEGVAGVSGGEIEGEEYIHRLCRESMPSQPLRPSPNHV